MADKGVVALRDALLSFYINGSKTRDSRNPPKCFFQLFGSLIQFYTAEEKLTPIQDIFYHKAPRKARKNGDFFAFSYFFLLLLGFELTFEKKSVRMNKTHMRNCFMTVTEKDVLRQEIIKATEEICEIGQLKKGQILVVGCSTSEVCGAKIGTESAPDVAQALVDGILSVLTPRGIYLAAQCCEHLNRAIIVERAALPFAQEVNVVPAPKAGGSFATAAYAAFQEPVALEEISANAGLDIGNTLIGMHLKRVAVPVRLSQKTIGAAPLVAARTRPKFIGGIRANYDENLL